MNIIKNLRVFPLVNSNLCFIHFFVCDKNIFLLTKFNYLQLTTYIISKMVYPISMYTQTFIFLYVKLEIFVPFFKFKSENT